MSEMYFSKEMKGYQEVVTASDDKNLSYIDFALLKMAEGDEFEAKTTDKEEVLIVLSGSLDVHYDGEWKEQAVERKGIFEDRPCGAYFPINYSYKLKPSAGCEEVEVAFCKAYTDEKTEPCIITQDKANPATRGKDNWEREVTMLDIPSATRLIIGEVINPPGNWSGIPPHKHDQEKPETEAVLEEIYYFRFAKENGYGVKRIYDRENPDELFSLRNGSAVRIDRGYHHVVAGPGYELWYLFMLAGPKKAGQVYVDPDEKFLLD